MSTRVDRLESAVGRRVHRDLGDGLDQLRQRRRGHGHLRPHALVPDFAADIDPSIVQLHSSDYRRPAQLQDGPVLVVGASHSGCDIAYEVAEHQPTILAGPRLRPDPVPARLAGCRASSSPCSSSPGRHVITRRTPIGRKEMGELRSHGGPMMRVKRDDLRSRGVERRAVARDRRRDGRPSLDDGRVLDVANVVWCTGFRQVFDWLACRSSAKTAGQREYRGVVETAPGLFFCGLAFQYAFSSMVFPGIGRDAGHVAEQIADRAAAAVARRLPPERTRARHPRVSSGGVMRDGRRRRSGRAREAFERRDWVAAYDRLTVVDPTRWGRATSRGSATAAYLLGQRQRLRAGAAAGLPGAPRRR